MPNHFATGWKSRAPRLIAAVMLQQPVRDTPGTTKPLGIKVIKRGLEFGTNARVPADQDTLPTPRAPATLRPVQDLELPQPLNPPTTGTHIPTN